MKQDKKDVGKRLRKDKGKVISFNLIKSIKHYKRCRNLRATFLSIMNFFQMNLLQMRIVM
jgi:hypothetical protein